MPARNLFYAWLAATLLSGIPSTLIGVLDLRIIAPRFFPDVAALEFWPQMADHLMWGLSFGLVLQKGSTQKRIGV